MKIFFLGGIFNPKEEDSIIKKSLGPIQFAANTLQWNLIKGISNIKEINLNIINAKFVGSYPKYYKTPIIKENEWNYSEVMIKEIGFINIFGIKHLDRGLSMSKKLSSWIHNNQSEKKYIIIYSMHTPFLYAAYMAKRKDPNIKVCLICPDLPEFMNTSNKQSKLLDSLKLIDRKVMNVFLESVDSFVVLTEFMKPKLNVGSKPYTVIEGVVNASENHQNSIIESSSTKVVANAILYTGTLNEKYGIKDLVEAFYLIENNELELWICGSGDTEEYLAKMSELDSRIKIFGQIKRDEILKLQREATLLVNPRKNNEEYTKFSFPSKIMEYLNSGTPTLMYKLDGIPKEYYPYFYHLNDNDSVYEFSKKLEGITNLSVKELNQMGEKAQKFVLQNKNSEIQALKIINMIKNS
jgi:glycosyltransferase involved in cell wall biosynthesis